MKLQPSSFARYIHILLSNNDRSLPLPAACAKSCAGDALNDMLHLNVYQIDL